MVRLWLMFCLVRNDIQLQRVIFCVRISFRPAALLVGAAALAVYLVPRLLAGHGPWPLWDVDVYWWGGRQALRDGAIYAAGAPRSFTYPPFAAALFGLTAPAPEIVLKVGLTTLSLAGLGLLCWQSVAATGLPRRRRPEVTFAAIALALLTVPVAYTLHLGEVNLILAGLIAADLLPRRDGAWWQGIGVGVAAGIKLTPLIFVAYLLLTRRPWAAAVAVLTFAGTVAVGAVLLPSQSRAFWRQGVFLNNSRIGNVYNPANQSLAGMLARLGGGLPAVYGWWIFSVLVTALAGLTVAALLHRRGHRLAALACCGVTGTLVSPMSWTHHWVWLVPLLIAMATAAWRRRSWLWTLATVALFAVFANPASLPWPGRDPTLLRTLHGNQYALSGLAVLVAAALFVVHEHRAPRRRSQLLQATPAAGPPLQQRAPSP